MRKRLSNLPVKMRGMPGHQKRTRGATIHIIWSGISVTLVISAIYAIAQIADQPLLVAPFTASAVLVCGCTESHYGQPRNLVGGHLLGALVAVALTSLHCSGWHFAIIAVGLATIFMGLTDTIHPPAGATAFLGVMGNVGPSYLLIPVLAGVLILLAAALFTNNIVHHRRYPTHWW